MAGGCSKGPSRPSAKAQLRELDSAKLLFDIGRQLLPDCGPGELDIVAAILERLVIKEVVSTQLD